ncbi:hypothetical protein BCV70DRAFT_197517 [Testicularia cyperi]|uniref:Nudix hydrolase domain-containing protein n=1 Tax=Testicularia cyperi TaxID=1882483 RepID=A0A317XZF8_9BASI|nr:hypothetical protein BCV70DRAFT_197517 [Testicularia cyperi]
MGCRRCRRRASPLTRTRATVQYMHGEHRSARLQALFDAQSFMSIGSRLLLLLFVSITAPAAAMKLEPREVAVAIPIQIQPSTSSSPSSPSIDDVRVCIVTSRKHDGKYVLPKGGIERGETSRQAAARELWEEAGLIANSHDSDAPLSSTNPQRLRVRDHKPHKHSPTSDPSDPDFVPRAIYTAHELVVQLPQGSKDDWPEQHERHRKWVSVQEAARQVEWRKDISHLFQLWMSGLPGASTSHQEL